MDMDQRRDILRAIALSFLWDPSVTRSASFFEKEHLKVDNPVPLPDDVGIRVRIDYVSLLDVYGGKGLSGAESLADEDLVVELEDLREELENGS